MAVKKTTYVWVVQPAITVIIIIATFNYSRGQQNQQIKECQVKVDNMQVKQDQFIKEIVAVLNEIKVELAEVKTEMKFINKRGQ